MHVFAVVTTSKVYPSDPVWGVRQVFRTIVESSSISVEKLCAGVPSSNLRVVAFHWAAAVRLIGIGKQQLTPGLSHVPLDVVRQQARCWLFLETESIWIISPGWDQLILNLLPAVAQFLRSHTFANMKG